MDNAKEQNHRDVEGHDSESLGEEYEGLLSGFKTSTARKKSIIIARLLPIFLLVSIGFNVVQLVYINVHQPQFYSLYGTCDLMRPVEPLVCIEG